MKSLLIQFGIQDAKKIAAEKAAKFPEMGDLAWHEERALASTLTAISAPLQRPSAG